jgi:anti-sigma-K factor RskA
MDDKIKHIIDSGLLEAYFLGLTDDNQSKEIAMLLESSPELRQRQEALDNLLFDMTGAMKVKPPINLRSKIKQAIKDNGAVDKPRAQMQVVKEKPIAFPRWLMAAASILLLAFAWVAYSNFNTAKDISEDLAEVRKELKIQKIQNLEMSGQLSRLADEFAFVNNITTKKFLLNGNTKASEFQMIAYWNDTEKKSMVAMSSFPDLPVGKCLQMWADVNGEMINVGILDANQTYTSIKFLDNATSLNVTIEPEGGSDHPTVSDLVANVFI